MKQDTYVLLGFLRLYFTEFIVNFVISYSRSEYEQLSLIYFSHPNDENYRTFYAKKL